MLCISSTSKQTAEAFTKARLTGGSLANYPGPAPSTLTEAYAIQDFAIRLWPHKVAGWKVGGIGGETAKELNQTKLAGPVFNNQIYKSNGSRVNMPVFSDGFAAIEGEFVIIVKTDAPADKLNWSLEEARYFVGAIHMGVEVASSPFAGINDMGPQVTISDFGNNNGLIIGQELPDWEHSKLEDWAIETIIDGQKVGYAMPPDPLISFRFILENAARRGMPLKKDMAITTGAITGVHQAFSGQSSTVKCSRVNDIELALVPAANEEA